MSQSSKSSQKKSSPSRPINWEQYGLNTSSAVRQSPQPPRDDTTLMEGEYLRSNDLYRDDPERFSKEWWKSNFFLTQPVLFGTWDGVFTSTVIHMFGVITFLRAGWLVGNAGIGLSALVVLTSVTICSIAALAAIGICQRCSHLSNGGNVHVLISNVLGCQFGGAISIIYCFGQAVSCALHVMGFAESLSSLLNLNDIWLERAAGIALVLLLLIINVAGVKWVIRLQFVLLLFLSLAATDFLIGIFVRTDPGEGVVGLSIKNLEDNWKPMFNYLNTNIFTVFGVFFPAVTGVMAGINMSGDLLDPTHNIPNGTFAAIGTSLLLYLLFIVGLAATCVRTALLNDYMIAQKVSFVGVFLITGLYISSISSCLGSLYATPRIIQNIANENIIPVLSCLSKGKGPNKIPVNALILFSLVTFLFIMIGDVNILAPIVTIPFLLTYATVEYSYFSLAMTFDIQILRESRFMASVEIASPTFDSTKKFKTSKHLNYGAVKTNTNDLDKLFPERVKVEHIVIKRQQSSQSSSKSSSPAVSPDGPKTPESSADESMDSSIDSTITSKCDQNEIRCKQDMWYSILTNRWLILFGAVIKIVIMFCVQWGYALSAVISALFLWYYIGQVNPGVFPGITEFRFWPWIKNLFLRCICKQDVDYKRIVVQNAYPNMNVTADQLTKQSTDYSSRQPYHQSSTAEFEAKPINHK